MWDYDASVPYRLNIRLSGRECVKVVAEFSNYSGLPYWSYVGFSLMKLCNQLNLSENIGWQPLCHYCVL